LGVFVNPGAQAYWHLIRRMFSPDFVEFAESAIRAKTKRT
jgi:hypothetical protein